MIDILMIQHHFLFSITVFLSLAKEEVCAVIVYNGHIQTAPLDTGCFGYNHSINVSVLRQLGLPRHSDDSTQTLQTFCFHSMFCLSK